MGDLEDIVEEGEPRLAPGTRLGKYAIVRLLGAGGMGAVYEALHTEIGKHVAVKVLGPAVAAIPGARARFLREAQITSRVRHPNIVDVTDMGNEGGQTYIVMELLSGEDLAHRLGRQGRMAEREVADIMLPVCAAVAAAHQAGITHRDLKPQNIFLATHQNGVQPTVLDFGISKGSDILGAGTLTGTGAMIGTPFYLAPEQILDNRSAGPASDQYSLGVILYECLTGRRPYEAENLFVVFQAIVAGNPILPRDLRPELSSALEEVLLRAMHVSPRHRFDSSHALGRALLPFATDRARVLWEEAFSADRPDTRPLPSATADGTPTPGGIPRTPLPPGGSSTPYPPDGQSGRALKPALTTPLPPATFPPPDPAEWLSFSAPKSPASVSGTRVMLPHTPSSPRPNVTSPGQEKVPEPLPEVRLGPKTSGRFWVLAGLLGCVGVAAVFYVWTQVTGPTGPIVDPRGDSPANPPPGDPSSSPQRKGPPTFESFRVSVATVPEDATVELDGTVVGSGSVERKMLIDHAPHTLRISADGFEPKTIEFTDTPPPHLVTLARRPVAPPTPKVEVADPTDSASPPQTASASEPGPGRRARSRSARGASASSGSSGTPRGTGRTRPRGATLRGDDAQPVLNPNGAPIID